MTAGDDEAVFMRDEYRYGVDGRSNVGFGFWQQAFGSKAVLDEASFDAAYDALTNQFTDEGRPLGVLPDLLVVGPSNRKKAQEVIKATRKTERSWVMAAIRSVVPRASRRVLSQGE